MSIERSFIGRLWVQDEARHILRMLALLTLTIIAVPAQAGVWGSPKFKITQSDDRFRADRLTVISSEGNRISKKSVAGGVHIDKQGVFLNPAVTMNRDTSEIVSLSFYLFNVTERYTGLGAPNSLGRPVRASFLTGEGLPIILTVEGGEQQHGQTHCPPGVSICTTTLIEGGIVKVSLQQYRRLIAAPALAIKIDGTERSRVYEVPDVAPTFVQNLTAFHSAYLARTPAD